MSETKVRIRSLFPFPIISFSDSLGRKLDEFLAEPLVVLLQFLHALLDGREGILNLLGGESRHDVLRTIPVKGLDVNYEDALDGGLVSRISESLDPFPGRIALEDFCSPQQLESRLRGIVDKDQCNAVIRRQIAAADVLLVSAKVGEGDGAVVDYLEEAGRAAAILNVRPARGADACYVEALALGQELLLLWAETVARGAGLLHFRVLPAAPMPLLQRLDRWREYQRAKVVRHGDSFPAADRLGFLERIGLDRRFTPSPACSTLIDVVPGRRILLAGFGAGKFAAEGQYSHSSGLAWMRYPCLSQ